MPNPPPKEAKRYVFTSATLVRYKIIVVSCHFWVQIESHSTCDQLLESASIAWNCTDTFNQFINKADSIVVVSLTNVMWLTRHVKRPVSASPALIENHEDEWRSLGPRPRVSPKRKMKGVNTECDLSRSAWNSFFCPTGIILLSETLFLLLKYSVSRVCVFSTTTCHSGLKFLSDSSSGWMSRCMGNQSWSNLRVTQEMKNVFFSSKSSGANKPKG